MTPLQSPCRNPRVGEPSEKQRTAGRRNRRIRALWLCLLPLVFATGLIQADPVPQTHAIDPGDCLVIVTSTTPFGSISGTGFAVGDGTLIVTAHHIVAEASEEGGHSMLGAVRVLSPYLGDCRYAEAIAVDIPLDLAVIKVSWAGHPAFEIANDDELMQAEQLETIGNISLISAIPKESSQLFPASFAVDHQILDVDFVAVRRQVPQFISLYGRGQLGPGWSGAPMLIPGTLKAVGCFVQLNRSLNDGRLTSRGPALAQVRRLAEQTGHSQSLDGSETLLTRADDGFEVSLLFLRTAKFLARDAYGWAGDTATKLLALRPRSAMVQVLAAWVQEKQGNLEAAEAHYQAALRLDANGSMLRLVYGQSFLDRDPEKAMEILQGLWEHRQMRPWLVLIVWDILRERDTVEKCTRMLQEALEVEPDNAYLWFNLGAVQWESGRREEGFASMTRAVELFPERGPLRGHLARLLEEEGRLDEAEDHLRRLLGIEPKNPVAYFWLARFLARHQPEAADEALRTARRALTLPCDDPALENQLRQLIREIRSERAPKAAPASTGQRDARSNAAAR